MTYRTDVLSDGHVKLTVGRVAVELSEHGEVLLRGFVDLRARGVHDELEERHQERGQPLGSIVERVVIDLAAEPAVALGISS